MLSTLAPTMYRPTSRVVAGPGDVAEARQPRKEERQAYLVRQHAASVGGPGQASESDADQNVGVRVLCLLVAGLSSLFDASVAWYSACTSYMAMKCRSNMSNAPTD